MSVPIKQRSPPGDVAALQRAAVQAVPQHAAAKPLQHSVQSVQSSGSAHQMITTLPLGMTCPIDMDAVHPPSHLSFKYPFSSTSYAISIPEKEQPLKGEIESYLMELQGGVSLPPPRLSSVPSKLGLEPQLGSLEGQHGGPPCPKAPSPSVTP